MTKKYKLWSEFPKGTPNSSNVNTFLETVDNIDEIHNYASLYPTVFENIFIKVPQEMLDTCLLQALFHHGLHVECCIWLFMNAIHKDNWNVMECILEHGYNISRRNESFEWQMAVEHCSVDTLNKMQRYHQPVLDEYMLKCMETWRVVHQDGIFINKCNN
jgi:hypothetical protein